MFEGIEVDRYNPYDPRYVRISNKPGVHAKGGGTSGKVDYPEHMKFVHRSLLYNSVAAEADLDGDVAAHSMMDALNSAYGNSPYDGISAYDPDTAISAMLTAICAYDTVVDALDHETDWESMVDAAVAKVDATILPSTLITAAVGAFSDDLDDRLENNVLPRFRAGMSDINAVMTSAYVIGQSVIEGMATKDVAKYEAELGLQFYADRSKIIFDAVKTMASLLSLRVEGEKNVATLTSEGNRIKIVSKQAEYDSNVEYDVKDALWDIDLFRHAGNLLASIGGGTAVQTTDGPSKGQSALGGAMTGLMMGASSGNPLLAAAGFIGGGIGGWLAG